jgi:alpha-mannosidase
VSVDRTDAFAALSMGAPSPSDYAAGNGVTVRVFEGGGRFKAHGGAGVADGRLPRLTDGVVAQNDDDTRNCSWFDNEGRFGMDLMKPLRIARVNTYSRHKSNRAPQRFTLWASHADTMPDPLFSAGKGSGWTLLGTVDSGTQGEGGCHGSS